MKILCNCLIKNQIASIIYPFKTHHGYGGTEGGDKKPQGKQNENQHHGQHDPEICNRWEVREIIKVVHKTTKEHK
jgi:hypothetical protein